jgi:hypothetical protein
MKINTSDRAIRGTHSRTLHLLFDCDFLFDFSRLPDASVKSPDETLEGSARPR